MSKHLLFCLMLCAFCIFKTHSQEIFRLDFESEFIPEGWTANEYAEWGHLLGRDGDNYFRFHARSNLGKLISPQLALTEGNYTLYYDWSELGDVNPDFVNIRLTKGNGPAMEIKDFGGLEGGGSHREWVSDSALLGDLETGNYTIDFQYKSTNKYPSTYINLDNITLMRRDLVITSVQQELVNVKLLAYPSPASTLLNIEIMDRESRTFDMNVVNAAGQLFHQKTNVPSGNHSLNVANWESGNYLLEIKDDSGHKVIPFVVLND